MRKVLSLCAAMAMSLTMSAQLAWDTEMTKDDFNNAQTVISKTENVSFSNPVLGIGGGLSVGKISIFSVAEDECVIALSQTGIAEKLSFAWQGGSNGTLTVYQSPDHNTWTQVYTANGNTLSLDTEAETDLATTTRYLKFAVSAHTAVVFRKIKVTELKRLGVSTDEWPFGSSMVDDPDETKNVTVTWTNIVADVSSTDPHFSASLSTVGQKNQIEQTTQMTIRYAHSEAGTHSGEIVIAGEGKEVRIAVSGETKKYDQTLSWIQTLDECVATDRIELNAFSTSALDIVYESSDNGIAYVEDGVVKIVRAGSVTLTATQPGNYKFNAAEPIAKTLLIHKADPMIGVHAEDATYGQTMDEVVLQETLGQVAGTLKWQDISDETLLDAGDYALHVLFTPADTGIYNTRVMPVALHINKAPQTIVWDGQETQLTVGEPISSTAALSSGLPITYAYTECLLQIEDGVITPENEGEVTVVAYHPGNQNYLPTTVTMLSFVINDAPVVSNMTEQSADRQQGAEKYVNNGKVYMQSNGRVYDAGGKYIGTEK